jgi:ATP-dependent RNA helicase SUPV3L1/SUV3
MRSTKPTLQLTVEAAKRALDEAILIAKTALTSTNDSQSQSQIHRLDPDQMQWKALRLEIEDLITRRVSDLNKDELAQRNKLTELLVAPKGVDMQTYLKHTYLDRVLKDEKLDIETAMSNVVDLKHPTEWFPVTRGYSRDIHLHIGPTNSGKTYTALKALEAARSGIYAGPLRLLAHEVYSRFNARGIKCDLHTGDDVRLETDPNAKDARIACTVEMVSTSQFVDVGVIDEIQMIADPERGWAWTRAFLGMRAKELHLCGEPRVLPLIKELAASTGDILHVHRYDRLNPLKVEAKSLQGDYKRLRKGDCVVTFSVVNIHSIRNAIEKDTGRRVAIVYGSLPPETRVKQAALFNDPNSDYDYLVASDAIGMGLNLAIRRIIFDSVHKTKLGKRVQLTIPQIKQIAGRAGRYRTSHDDTKQTSTETTTPQPELNPKSFEETMRLGFKSPPTPSSSQPKPPPTHDPENIGLVTSFEDADLPIIRDALAKEAPPIEKAGIVPPGDFAVAYAERLPDDIPLDYVMQRVADAADIDSRFFLCDVTDRMSIARNIAGIPGMSAHQRTLFTAAPADPRRPENQKAARAIARAIGAEAVVTVADLEDIPLETLEKPLQPDRSYLKELETLHKALILYLWLSYRFSNYITDKDMAFHAKGLCEERISLYLSMFTPARVRRRKEQEMALQSEGLEEDYGESAREDLEEEDGIEEREMPGEDGALPQIDWGKTGAKGLAEVLKIEVGDEGDAGARANGVP